MAGFEIFLATLVSSERINLAKFQMMKLEEVMLIMVFNTIQVNIDVITMKKAKYKMPKADLILRIVAYLMYLIVFYNILFFYPLLGTLI